MQESVRKEQKRSQTLLTWPTSLEMLRTGLITTYPRLRLLVISGFIHSGRREKTLGKGRRLSSLRTYREWIDDNCSPLTPLRISNPVEEGLRRDFWVLS